MDRLDQLVARSQREIEAHTNELGDTDTGRYFINEASHLLAALRLWAQSQYRTDHVVRDILEAGDVVALHDVSRELHEIGTHDGQSAGWVHHNNHEQIVGRADDHRFLRSASLVTPPVARRRA